MKLVASVIVAEVERDRYLVPCVGHLLEFCDEVVLLFDGDYRWARDLVGSWGDAGERVIGVTPGADEDPVGFLAHEGRARQRLLDATLARDPSHVLAIDADEFVSDGAAIRDACGQTYYGAWGLCMEEIWNASPGRLELRQDGGWGEHDVVVLWRPDKIRGGPARIPDKPLACPRVPDAVRRTRTGCAGSSILHFGWTNRAERQARYDRYAIADGGKFHAKAHLDSIMLPDSRIELSLAGWPPALAGYREQILARASGDASTISVAVRPLEEPTPQDLDVDECPDCGQPWAADARACPGCGLEIEEVAERVAAENPR